MKIALFSWEARYATQISGIATHVADLARALAESGHEVHIFTRQGAGQALTDLIAGVYYHRCPWSRDGNFLREVTNFNRALIYYYNQTALETGGFDLIHCHDWLTFEAGGKLKEQDPSLRYVVTFHTTEWGRSGSWPEHGQPRLIADLEATATQQADAAIVISYEIRRQVELLYRCPEWKITVIYHGISLTDFDRCKPLGTNRPSVCNLPPEAKITLYVGALNFRKGADLLSAAAGEIIGACPQSHVIFAGAGEMQGRLEAEARAGCITARVHFVGEPAAKDLLRLYHAATLVCIPYRYDPFGVVALCAWAAGKPVVVSGGGAAAEFVYNKVNGLRCAEDKLGESAGMLLTEADQARWMGRNGRVAAETAFSWESVAEQTLSAYAKSPVMA